MNILCRMGIHKASKYSYIVQDVIKGKHKYRRCYACCKRCGKRLHRITRAKEK